MSSCLKLNSCSSCTPCETMPRLSGSLHDIAIHHARNTAQSRSRGAPEAVEITGCVRSLVVKISGLDAKRWVQLDWAELSGQAGGVGKHCDVDVVAAGIGAGQHCPRGLIANQVGGRAYVVAGIAVQPHASNRQARAPQCQVGMNRCLDPHERDSWRISLEGLKERRKARGKDRIILEDEAPGCRDFGHCTEGAKVTQPATVRTIRQ